MQFNQYVEETWFCWKILLFGQYMGHKWVNLDSMPIYGHTFFGHNSAIFWLIKLKFRMVTQETIIYRLTMRNKGYGHIFDIWIFGPLFGPKKGVAPHSAIRVLDLKTQPKSWPKVWSFWIMYYLKIMLPKIFDLDPPLM